MATDPSKAVVTAPATSATRSPSMDARSSSTTTRSSGTPSRKLSRMSFTPSTVPRNAFTSSATAMSSSRCSPTTLASTGAPVGGPLEMRLNSRATTPGIASARLRTRSMLVATSYRRSRASFSSTRSCPTEGFTTHSDSSSCWPEVPTTLLRSLAGISSRVMVSMRRITRSVASRRVPSGRVT